MDTGLGTSFGEVPSDSAGSWRWRSQTTAEHGEKHRMPVDVGANKTERFTAYGVPARATPELDPVDPSSLGDSSFAGDVHAQP